MIPALAITLGVPLTLGITLGVLLALGEMLVIAAAGTFKRGPDWTDYVALVGPLVAMTTIIVFFVVFSWHIALLLSLTIVALTLWGVVFLVKIPARKRTA